jgi:hypothetical protein
MRAGSKKISFKAEVLSGHKDDAVEVPFNPSETWHLEPRPLWRGRKGHRVSGTLNGKRFAEAFIVPRAKKFFLIIDKEMEQAAGVSLGDVVRLSVEPTAE